MTHLIASILAAGGLALVIAAPEGACDSKESCDSAKACDSTKVADTTPVSDTTKACDSDKSCDTKTACDSDKGVTAVADASDDTQGDAKGACCALKGAEGSTTAVASTERQGASAYDTAAWPSHNTDLYAKDFQGKALPVSLGSETWLTEKVETQGKVVVLDFWATWCGPCRAASPILDKLQKGNKDSLAVLAIAGQRDPIENVRSYVNEHPVSYAHLYDEKQSVYKPFESRGIPLVVVMSTDGVVRWMGNPHEPDFIPAVEAVLKADPKIETAEG